MSITTVLSNPIRAWRNTRRPNPPQVSLPSEPTNAKGESAHTPRGHHHTSWLVIVAENLHNQGLFWEATEAGQLAVVMMLRFRLLRAGKKKRTDETDPKRLLERLRQLGDISHLEFSSVMGYFSRIGRERHRANSTISLCRLLGELFARPVNTAPKVESRTEPQPVSKPVVVKETNNQAEQPGPPCTVGPLEFPHGLAKFVDPGRRAHRLLIRDDFRCRFCGRDLLESLDALFSATIDHVVPKAAGGGEDLPNLVVCCSTCNAIKAARRTRTVTEAQYHVSRERIKLTDRLAGQFAQLGIEFPRREHAPWIATTYRETAGLLAGQAEGIRKAVETINRLATAAEGGGIE